MQFLVIWRFFRLAALAEGMDCPENMRRCFANNYDIAVGAYPVCNSMPQQSPSRCSPDFAICKDVFTTLESIACAGLLAELARLLQPVASAVPVYTLGWLPHPPCQRLGHLHLCGPLVNTLYSL